MQPAIISLVANRKFPRIIMRMIERWDAATYPLWHGFAPMGAILSTAGPGEMFVRGDGAWVIDRNGRRYLDARSGIANMMLGYSRRDIVERMHRQAIELPFVCTMRYDRPAPVVVEFAQVLTDAAAFANLRRVRFTQTGTAATEAALLMARQYHRNLRRQQKTVTVSVEGGYHGTSLMAMAASGQPGMHGLFAPMPEGFVHLAPPDIAGCPICAGKATSGPSCVDPFLAGIEKVGPEKVAAVIVEAVNALNGVALPSHFLRTLREFCTRHDILLIVDEVFSGFGRMGPMFACELSGVSPDIMCLSKGITAGYAGLGAVLATNEVYQAFDGPDRVFFVHGSSTDGHPIACAAGLATMEAYRREDVLARGSRMGTRLHSLLTGLLADCSSIAAVRATGSYIALDMVGAHQPNEPMEGMREIQIACENRGVLIDFTPDILMLVPPLVLTEDECQFLAESVVGAIREVECGPVARAATA
jgi:adenosylmethionine-8-amino-7-oxononanoate aminotransferase